MQVKRRLDFSQYGQPAFIRLFIPEETPHWLVDVGAHDGITGSNSRGFILDNWTALLVEPLPAAFDKLRAQSEGFKNVALEQYACADFNGEAKFQIGLDGADGQTSTLCRDESWKQNHSGQEVTVRVRTLTDLLDRHRFPKDFGLLLVDAEGMDLEVLSGLDFSLYRPAVICSEVYEANPDKDRRKAELLECNGYCLRGRVGSDNIWSRQAFGMNAGAALFQGNHLPYEVERLSTSSGGVMAFDRASFVAGVLTVSGWAVASEQIVPGLIFVGVRTPDGTRWQQSERCHRPDVAEHFGNQGLLFSGFRARFLLTVESPIEVTIVQVEGDRRWDTSAARDLTYGWV
jgi:FkbM family methyltransferase